MATERRGIVLPLVLAALTLAASTGLEVTRSITHSMQRQQHTIERERLRFLAEGCVAYAAARQETVRVPRAQDAMGLCEWRHEVPRATSDSHPVRVTVTSPDHRHRFTLTTRLVVSSAGVVVATRHEGDRPW